MQSVQLLENVEFRDNNPYSQPLLVAPHSRILRFSLRPGQAVAEHQAPTSPVHIVVLQGHGLFAGGDGQETRFGPNALLMFEAGERHSIRALDEDLVFVVFLREAPGVGQFAGRVMSQREGQKG
jgi:quercetin dioxygenase-like cupin family protein